MSTCSDPNPLRRDGLSQSQRRLPALDPASIRLDERTGDDLLAFAADYARAVGLRFYAPDSTVPAAGHPPLPTWEPLMTPPGGLSRAELEARSDNPPHLALFLAFLKLFGLAQEQLNTFTQRHLDFYYRDVLRLSGRPAQADQVHLTFELARNVAEQVVPAGTEFEAGVDAAEQPLLYQAAAARVVNRAGLAHLRAVVLDATGANAPVRFAPNPATADGVAAALPAADPAWSAFGGKSTEVWPVADLGFALAAPVLLLAEGNREITVTLTATQPLDPDLGTTGPQLYVQLSGAKAWLEPAEQPRLTAGSQAATYQFTVTVPASEKQAIVAYDAAKLDGGYVTTAPVMRVLLANPADYQALRGLALSSVRIDVAVTGLRKSLVLDNDLGPLNPDKPFLPFGSVPGAGSTLYLDCPEAAGKELSSLTVTVTDWLGKPLDWDAYYDSYVRSSPAYAEANLLAAVTVQSRTLNVANKEVALFDAFLGSGLVISNELARSKATFLQGLGSKLERYKRLGSTFAEFSPLQDFVETATPAPAPAVQERLLTIRLSQDLGQRDYPTLLTKALTQAAATTVGKATAAKEAPQDPGAVVDTTLPIPNPPYVPLAQALLLSYQASTGEVALDTLDATEFAQREVQLFHQHVFGQAEEHVQLKQRLPWLRALKQDAATATAGTSAYLLPQLALGGTLLLGLRDVGPRETVAVLFQVAEGSANPARDPAQVVWSVLSQNQWLPLRDANAPLDHTDHLLTSGIIEFSLPAETRLDNTLLESGLVWLKGELQTLDGRPALPDSVARLVALHPQAALARFVGPATDPAHYTEPLAAGTITKARAGLAGIRAVRQPYPSFGGQPAETDAAFYSRVSERLRHKQRAVTIWDYEHLVLEKFPSLYKVQCLNHTQVVTATNKLLERAPGCVTLVVVPNLRHAYAANPLEPAVAQHTLTAVCDFAQAHAGPQVRVQVVNPAYEAVQVGGKVAFRVGYPAATYQARLSQDLCAYLAPWAYAATAELAFGGTLHKSTVLAFIEQLPYVDFVTELTLTLLVSGAPADQETIEASSARSVLGSAPTHVFTEIPRRVLPATF